MTVAPGPVPAELAAVTAAAADLERSRAHHAAALHHAVHTARTAGHSWARIGAALGCTAQSAHARYAKTGPV